MKKTFAVISLIVLLALAGFAQTTTTTTDTDCTTNPMGINCTSTSRTHDNSGSYQLGQAIGSIIARHAEESRAKTEAELGAFRDRVVHAAFYEQFRTQFPDWLTYAEWMMKEDKSQAKKSKLTGLDYLIDIYKRAKDHPEARELTARLQAEKAKREKQEAKAEKAEKQKKF
jgi:hypothetical protein